MAAEILKGRQIAKDVRAIIIPATQSIYKECLKKGYIEDFINAGCIVSTPTCGPCLGGYMGILAAGERCISTTNRNFVGRMGHTESEVFLASPAVAAASAIMGKIADPRIVNSKAEKKAEKQAEKKAVKANKAAMKAAEKAEKAAGKAAAAMEKVAEAEDALDKKGE